MLVINFNHFAIVSDNQIVYNIMGCKSVIVTDKVISCNTNFHIFFHLQLIIAADDYIICNFNANKLSVTINDHLLFSLNMKIMRPTACLHLSFTKFQMSLRDMNLTI